MDVNANVSAFEVAENNREGADVRRVVKRAISGDRATGVGRCRTDVDEETFVGDEVIVSHGV